MYDAIVFDLDGVLLDRHPEYPAPYREAVAEAFRSFDVEPSDADLEPFCGDKSLEGMRAVCDCYGIAFEECWPERERQSSLLQRDLMAEGYRAPFDDVDVLAELASDHALGIVSSNQHATVEAVVERFDFGDAIDVAYGRAPSVEGYQRRKPDTYYVEQALADLGTRDVLFVGDRESDVVVADRAGLDAAYLARPAEDVSFLAHEGGAETLAVAPEYEIATLTELAAIIRDGGATST